MNSSEALQASFVASNWQTWVRQLGFSNGSLWHSSSPFFLLSVCLSSDCVGLWVLLLTPGQEVFGSSVVSCPECYPESSSGGRPTSRLSAASPCVVGGNKKNKKKEHEYMSTDGLVIKKSKKSKQTSSSAFTRLDRAGTRTSLGNHS